MTNAELSNGFDTLVSSYRRFRDFDHKEPFDTIEFDEYEKSFYLTKAQEELVISLYNGRNSSGKSFEETEELRRYLSPLVLESTLEPEENAGFTGVSSNSAFFTLPEDLWFITYEALNYTGGRCDGERSMEVIPITQDEYHRVKKNPFRGPTDMRALRLDLSNNVIEVVSKYNVVSYYLRYLRRPVPIVLEDLPNDLSINGHDEATECELHENLHQRILERAVLLALQSKGSKNNIES